MQFITLNNTIFTQEDIRKIISSLSKNHCVFKIYKRVDTIKDIKLLDAPLYNLYLMLEKSLLNEQFSFDINNDELPIDIQFKSIMDFLINKDAVLLDNIELHFCYKENKGSKTNYNILFKIISERYIKDELYLRITLGNLSGLSDADEYYNSSIQCWE